jgi:hypothetical protein
VAAEYNDKKEKMEVKMKRVLLVCFIAAGLIAGCASYGGKKEEKPKQGEKMRLDQIEGGQQQMQEQ